MKVFEKFLQFLLHKILSNSVRNFKTKLQTDESVSHSSHIDDRRQGWSDTDISNRF